MHQVKEMTIRGVGKKLGLVGGFCGILCILISLIYWPFFSYIHSMNYVLFILGIVILIIGLVLHIFSVIQLNKAYKGETLKTDGMYFICRNPMYATLILLIIPGLSLIINSWLIITASILMYILLRVFIKEEEEFLLNKFGQVYIDYRNRTCLVFPTIWKKGN